MPTVVSVLKRLEGATVLELVQQRGPCSQGTGCLHLLPGKAIKAHAYFLVAETEGEVLAMGEAQSELARLYQAVRAWERKQGSREALVEWLIARASTGMPTSVSEVVSFTARVPDMARVAVEA